MMVTQWRWYMNESTGTELSLKRQVGMSQIGQGGVPGRKNIKSRGMEGGARGGLEE